MMNEVTLPLVTNEAEIQAYYENVSEEVGLFQLESQPLGDYTYYRWKAQMKEDVAFEGRMDIPSIRLYFITQTRKGFQIEVDKSITTVQANTHNIFFSAEECFGKDLFHKNDTIEVITIAITAQQFAQIASQYPDTFMPWYERYEKNGNFTPLPKPLPAYLICNAYRSLPVTTGSPIRQRCPPLYRPQSAGTPPLATPPIRPTTVATSPILQNPNRYTEDVRSARFAYCTIKHNSYNH